MLNKDELKFLSEQLAEYRLHEKEFTMAATELSKVLDELKKSFIHDGNIIAYHDSRIKKEDSYLKKLLKSYNKGNILTYDDMHDIVGHRLVFLHISDIYKFADMLKNSKKIKVIDEPKDYIANPKESGYRSYHLILEIPVIDEYGIEHRVKTEVQLRTIFMDIFAREEHKISYKGSGNISEAEKKELKDLSDELYFYDLSLDNMPRPDLKEPIRKSSKLEEEYKKLEKLYKIIYWDLNSFIQSTYQTFDKKNDILHIVGRTKDVSSLKRKLVKKGLKFNSENIRNSIKDIIGFKVVCTDSNSLREYIEHFKKSIEGNPDFKIEETSDHLGEPKISGYRGFKFNLTCKYIEPIEVEVLIRTMVQDAWALQQDAIVYNKENCYEDHNCYVENARGLRGLSTALNRVELELNKIKENNSNERKSSSVAEEVSKYITKEPKKLIFVKKEKDEQ